MWEANMGIKFNRQLYYFLSYGLPIVNFHGTPLIFIPFYEFL